MNLGKKTLLVAFAVTLATGTLTTASAAGAAPPDDERGERRPPGRSTTSSSAPITALDVQNDAGDVSVKAGDKTAVSTREDYNFFRPTVTVRNEKGVLTVRSSCPSGIFAVINDCSVSLAITVPASAKVKAVAVTGLNVADMTSDQVLRTAAGGVNVARVMAANVNATSGSGRIVIANSKVANVIARSSSGGILLENLVAPDSVSARTSSGSVDIVVPAGKYAITADSASGKVRIVGLTNDAASPHKIVAITSSGSVLVRAAEPQPAPKPAPAGKGQPDKKEKEKREREHGNERGQDDD